MNKTPEKHLTTLFTQILIEKPGMRGLDIASANIPLNLITWVTNYSPPPEINYIEVLLLIM